MALSLDKIEHLQIEHLQIEHLRMPGMIVYGVSLPSYGYILQMSF